jgi:hypothetical protein
MTENTNQEEKKIIIHLESTEYTVAPGSSIVIPIELTNTGTTAGNYQMFVEDIPPNWVSTTSPVTHLDAGEEKQITLVIQPPTITETGPGNFPFTIRVVNQADAMQVDKVKVSLTVAAYEVEGRIGVMMESTQYSVSPGTGTTVQLLLHNQGLADDEFQLSVEGIPVSWISTDSPVTKLAAGEQRKVKMTIIPPPAPGSRAGRYSFKIQVISSQAPDQMAEIDCTLTVAAVASFSSELKPEEIRDGQVGSLVVTNSGNIQGAYDVLFETEEDTLVFDPPEPQQLQVPAGESAAVEYSAKPQKKQLIGSDLSYPFTAKVKSSDEEAQILEGKMIAEALIPFWVIPVVLVLCLAVICVSFGVFVFRTQSAEGQQATQTAAVYFTETAVAGGVLPTDTLEPGETPLPTEIPTEGPPPSEVPTEGPIPTETPIPSETPIPTATGVPTNTPIVIPDVGRIAFQSNREGDPELYIQDTGTGAIARLTTSLGVDTHPAYSPDGSRLAFTSDRTGDNEIYVANADGSDQINISNNPATDQTPSWSPDGQWIAFATNRDGNLEIYIMRPDGSDPQNLTNSPADDQTPSWFSGLIAFQSNRDNNQEIYLMNTDGSDQRNLTNNPFNDTWPSGAPNGSRIAFTTDRDGNLEVYSMGTDGSNQTNLTNNPSADQISAWSPDGNWIAFITDRDLNQEIYMMRDNGSEVYNVTNNPATDIVPAWQ